MVLRPSFGTLTALSIPFHANDTRAGSHFADRARHGREGNINLPEIATALQTATLQRHLQGVEPSWKWEIVNRQSSPPASLLRRVFPRFSFRFRHGQKPKGETPMGKSTHDKQPKLEILRSGDANTAFHHFTPKDILDRFGPPTSNGSPSSPCCQSSIASRIAATSSSSWSSARSASRSTSSGVAYLPVASRASIAHCASGGTEAVILLVSLLSNSTTSGNSRRRCTPHFLPRDPTSPQPSKSDNLQ
jgi:hypothetical protein